MADEVFQRRLLRALGKAAANRVRPKIVSYKGKPIRALQRALKSVLVNDERVELQIPHFWSVYVHEGRRVPVTSRTGLLIWYRNPKRDPRLNAGVTPERAAKLRHLSNAEFKDAQAENYEAQRQGREPPVIIIPAGLLKRATPPSPFFENEPGGGMFGFEREASEIAQQEFQSFALTSLRSTLGVSSFIPRGGGSGINVTVERDGIELSI